MQRCTLNLSDKRAFVINKRRWTTIYFTSINWHYLMFIVNTWTNASLTKIHNKKTSLMCYVRLNFRVNFVSLKISGKLSPFSFSTLWIWAFHFKLKKSRNGRLLIFKFVVTALFSSTCIACHFFNIIISELDYFYAWYKCWAAD